MSFPLRLCLLIAEVPLASFSSSSSSGPVGTGAAPPPSASSGTHDQLLPRAVRVVKVLAYLMDHAVRIPFTNVRIGLDAVMGAWPIWGDVLSLLLGLYTVAVALQLRLPVHIVSRMVGNLAYDFALGLVPVVGDWLDANHRAHLKNAVLLEEAFYRYVTPRWHSANGRAGQPRGSRSGGTDGGPVIDVEAHPISSAPR